MYIYRGYGSPPNGHDGHIFRGAKLILAQKAILHIIECVLVYCVGWPLSLQLEYQHTIVMTWVHKHAHMHICIYSTRTFTHTCTCRYTCSIYMYMYQVVYIPHVCTDIYACKWVTCSEDIESGMGSYYPEPFWVTAKCVNARPVQKTVHMPVHTCTCITCTRATQII